MRDEGLDRAELFDIFSNTRRRYAVRYLLKERGSCSLGGLVKQIAAWENEVQQSDLTRTQRRRVYISLYQTHLPMLEDAGIIAWDPDTHEIELEVSGKQFEPYLERPEASRTAWPRVYGSVSLLGAGAMAIAMSSMGPLESALAPLLAIALCGVVVGISAIHRQSGR